MILSELLGNISTNVSFNEEQEMSTILRHKDNSKFLFLGNYKDSKNTNFLKLNNITHILNISSDHPTNETKKEFNYLFIDIPDSRNSNISQHFKKCHDFISKYNYNNYRSSKREK
jgi:hypothetical protein